MHYRLTSLKASLTSTLGVRAFLIHGSVVLRFSRLFFRRLRLHVGLTPVPVLAVATVVSVLTIAAAAVACSAVAAGMTPMFLDLPLCQEACGLSSARDALVLLVFPIELPIKQETESSVRAESESSGGFHCTIYDPNENLSHTNYQLESQVMS